MISKTRPTFGKCYRILKPSEEHDPNKLYAQLRPDDRAGDESLPYRIINDPDYDVFGFALESLQQKTEFTLIDKSQRDDTLVLSYDHGVSIQMGDVEFESVSGMRHLIRPSMSFSPYIPEMPMHCYIAMRDHGYTLDAPLSSCELKQFWDEAAQLSDALAEATRKSYVERLTHYFAQKGQALTPELAITRAGEMRMMDTDDIERLRDLYDSVYQGWAHNVHAIDPAMLRRDASDMLMIAQDDGSQTERKLEIVRGFERASICADVMEDEPVRYMYVRAIPEPCEEKITISQTFIGFAAVLEEEAPTDPVYPSREVVDRAILLEKL